MDLSSPCHACLLCFFVSLSYVALRGSFSSKSLEKISKKMFPFNFQLLSDIFVFFLDENCFHAWSSVLRLLWVTALLKLTQALERDAKDKI